MGTDPSDFLLLEAAGLGADRGKGTSGGAKETDFRGDAGGEGPFEVVSETSDN